MLKNLLDFQMLFQEVNVALRLSTSNIQQERKEKYLFRKHKKYILNLT